MQSITQLRDLTTEELARVQATLRARFAAQPNVLDVAFGLPEKDGEIDKERGACACFYVERKTKHPRSSARIPARVDVRIKRGVRFCKVSLPTDVIETRRRSAQPTGRVIRHTSFQEDRATSGSVIVWRVPGVNRLYWGVITVGHLFGGMLRVPELTNRVLLEFANEQFLSGQLLARTEVDDGSLIDASIVQVSRKELVDHGLVPQKVDTRGRRVRAWNELCLDVGKRGFSLPECDPVDFLIVRVLPTSKSVSALGTLEKVIEAISNTPRAFARGSSGSLWQVQQQAAAIQHGGLSWQFLRGWGQSLESIIEWARNQLAAVHDVAASEIDLRLVYAI